MTISIGRFGLPSYNGGDDGVIAAPTEWAQSGREARVKGISYIALEADLIWAQDQLSGLRTLDEQAAIVPVQVTDLANTQYDGFYQVLDSSSTISAGVLGTSGTRILEWDVTLRRIDNWQQPQMEVTTFYGVRSNGNGVTTGTVVTSMPSPYGWRYLQPSGAATLTTRPTSEATSIQIAYDTGRSDVGSFVARGRITPTYYYLKGCRAEYTGGGLTSYRQIIGAGMSGLAPSSIRLSNAMVRVSPHPSTVGTLQFWWWDGTVWDGPTNISLSSATHDFLTWDGVEVVRNTPEESAIRLYGSPVTATAGTAMVDVSVRRGVRHVTLGVESTLAGAWKLAHTGAYTSLNAYSMRLTSNDAGGNRPVLMAAPTVTQTLASGYQTLNSAATAAVLGVTCEIGGSGAAGQNTAINQVAEWMYAISETGVVVSY